MDPTLNSTKYTGNSTVVTKFYENNPRNSNWRSLNAGINYNKHPLFYPIAGDADGPGTDAYLRVSTDGNGEASAKSKNNGLTGQILSIAVPALVALSVDPLMSAVDTAYIGRLAAEHGGGEVCHDFFPS